MFYSPIYLGMTILIELSNCWGLSRLVEILGITEKEIPRGSDSWTQCGMRKAQGWGCLSAFIWSETPGSGWTHSRLND